MIVGTPNAGRVSLLSRLVGSSGRALIVEPEQRNYERLVDEATEFGNVDVCQKGAWSRSETQTLQIAAPENPADHKIDIDGVEHDNDYRSENYIDEQEITVDRLDNIFSEYGISPDYIQIMINGGELEALKGTTESLEEDGPRLWVKGHALDVSEGKPINSKIQSLLDRHGYESVISKGGHETVGDVDQWDQRSGDVYGWLPDRY